MLSGIPEATNRQPFSLIVATSVDIAIVVIQGAVPGNVCNELRRTTPVTAVANAVECPISTTTTGI